MIRQTTYPRIHLKDVFVMKENTRWMLDDIIYFLLVENLRI